MTIQVIETKRSPPLWSVKVDRRFVAEFVGPDARAKAEALASEMGGYEVKPKPPLAGARPAWRRRPR
jgi:hypothetical protein